MERGQERSKEGNKKKDRDELLENEMSKGDRRETRRKIEMSRRRLWKSC